MIKYSFLNVGKRYWDEKTLSLILEAINNLSAQMFDKKALE